MHPPAVALIEHIGGVPSALQFLDSVECPGSLRQYDHLVDFQLIGARDDGPQLCLSRLRQWPRPCESIHPRTSRASATSNALGEPWCAPTHRPAVTRASL